MKAGGELKMKNMIRQLITWIRELFKKKDLTPAPLPVVPEVVEPTNRAVKCFKCGAYYTLRKIQPTKNYRKKAYICQKCFDDYKNRIG